MSVTKRRRRQVKRAKRRVAEVSTPRRLCEQVISSDYEIVEDIEEGKSPVHRIKNILIQRADVPNRNNRVYPAKTLRTEVARLGPLIESGSVMAQADHPGPDDGDRISNVVLVWSNIRMNESGEVRGDGTFAMTESGRDVIEVAKAGGRVGVSSRGTGTTKRETRNGIEVDVVQEDLNLKTFDIVVGESVHGANFAGSDVVEERFSVDLAESGNSPNGQENSMGKEANGDEAEVRAEDFSPDTAKSTLTAGEYEKAEAAWRAKFNVPTEAELAKRIAAEVEERHPGLMARVEAAEANATAMGTFNKLLTSFIDGLRNVGWPEEAEMPAFLKKKKKKNGDDDEEDDEEESAAIAAAEKRAKEAEAEAAKAKADAAESKAQVESTNIRLWLADALAGDPKAEVFRNQIEAAKPATLEEAKVMLEQARAFASKLTEGLKPAVAIETSGKPTGKQGDAESVESGLSESQIKSAANAEAAEEAAQVDSITKNPLSERERGQSLTFLRAFRGRRSTQKLSEARS